MLPPTRLSSAASSRSRASSTSTRRSSKSTKRADAVINAASSDNPFVAHALLTGLAGSGKTLIQVSGSSVISTYDNGERSDNVFHEESIFTPAPEKAMRVAIDRSVLAAAQKGVRSIVIRPSLIYGRGIGSNAASVQVPKLIDAAKKAGKPRHVGRGLNIWSHVHVADVVDRCSCLRWRRRRPAQRSTSRTARPTSRR